MQGLTEEAEQGTEKGAGLEGRRDVARDHVRIVRREAEGGLEALAVNGRADEGRVVTETRQVAESATVQDHVNPGTISQ